MRCACTDWEEIGGNAAGITNSAIIVWVIARVSWLVEEISYCCASLVQEGIAEEKKEITIIGIIIIVGSDHHG